MEIIKTDLYDCYIIEPDCFGDHRGYYSPYFRTEDFAQLGFKEVQQASRSMNKKGVLRGLHFQEDPMCQAKLVEVISGKAIDVVVDLRNNSSTFGKAISVLLTDQNNRQLFVPRGFAHGFLSLEDHTLFQYIVDNKYAPDKESGILWSDPTLNISWQDLFKTYHIMSPEISPKDAVREPLDRNKTYFKR